MIREVGLGGVHHVLEDGKYRFIGKWADMDQNTRMNAMGGLLGRLAGHVPGGIMSNQEVNTNPLYEPVREAQKWMEPLTKPIPVYRLSVDDQTTMREALGDMETYIAEMTTKFIIGQAPFSQWDEYVATINRSARSGIEQTVAALQNYYDSNLR